MVRDAARGWGGWLRRWLPPAVAVRAAAIMAAALAAAITANILSPRRIPWVEDWSHYVEQRAFREGIRIVNFDQLERMLSAGSAVVLDARPLAEYDRGHIPGALPFPEGEKQTFAEQYSALLRPESRLVAYCSGGSCDESLQLLLYLRSLGCTNLALYPGGWQEWTRLARKTPR